TRTPEGHDMLLAVNHLGPFLLTNLLLPLLQSSAPARVVNVASDAHRFGKLRLDILDRPHSYGLIGMPGYGETKLMNILFEREHVGLAAVTHPLEHEPPDTDGRRDGLARLEHRRAPAMGVEGDGFGVHALGAIEIGGDVELHEPQAVRRVRQVERGRVVDVRRAERVRIGAPQLEDRATAGRDLDGRRVVEAADAHLADARCEAPTVGEGPSGAV